MEILKRAEGVGPRPNEQQKTFTTHNEWFATFLKHTNQKAVTQEAVLQGISNQPDIQRRITDTQYPFNLLYVGVGNGGLEIPLTQNLITQRGSLENIAMYCEDPSTQLRDQFLTDAQKVGIEKTIRNYDLRNFEDPAYAPPQVDLAIASHVGYYIEDWVDKNPQPDNSLGKF